MVEINGFTADGFEAVRDAFAANFDLQPDLLGQMLGHDVCEVGAAVSVWHRGEKVVDLWGGEADRRDHSPYAEDTLQLVFSTTKGVTAIAANLLVQRGELDLDAKVADYWPEFAQAGKADIPVRWLLSHRAGLPWVDGEMTLEQALDWDYVIDALERQAPVWEPGTQHGYHATTFGWLVGEVVRRVTGKRIGAFVQRELSGPLGLDLWIGLPAEQHDRVAPLEVIEFPDDPTVAAMVDQFIGPETMLGQGAVRAGQRVGRSPVRLVQPARGVGGRDPRRQLHHRRPLARQALRRRASARCPAPMACPSNCSTTTPPLGRSSTRPRASTRC